MKTRILEIIEKQGGNNELLFDYWKFVDEIKFDFAFTAKFLMNKYNLEGYDDLSARVTDAGSLLIKKLKDCNNCYADFVFSNRANFKNLKLKILREDIICYDCKKLRNLKKVKKMIVDIQEHECKLSNENLELLELSYLEKIYLYLLIENYKNSPLKNWNSLYALNYSGNQFLVRKIIEKGYIKEIKGCHSCNLKQAELRSLLMENQKEFDGELKNKIKNYLNLNFDYHCKIVVPEKINDIDSWLIEIYSNIINAILTINDVKEIEEFILNQRFFDIYRLVGLVCEKNSIPWKKDNAFDYEISRMIGKYNLEVIFNILNYCAKNATSQLYKMEKLSDSKFDFKKNHVFRYEISARIDKLDKSDNVELYSKSLPYGWVDSEEELFINSYIIESDKRWSKYTPKEILNMLLSKKNFNID